MNINIKNEKYETFTSKLKYGSVDFVCIDPPYVGYNNKGAVLGGHKIQTELSISNVMEEAFRITKDNSFFAFFGQMPTIVDWHIGAGKAGFVFKEHIVWAKRRHSSPFHKISRKHEEIFLYKKGNPNYNKTDAKFEDLKIPELPLGLTSFSNIKRYIADLHKRINDSIYNDKFKLKSEEHGFIININRNDTTYMSKVCDFKYRSKRLNNISNIWSFSPENTKNINSNNTKHPTVKPIILLERLIELCTAEPTKEYKPIVCDFFLGSGTTAISSINTNRNFTGCEIDKDYFDICIERTEKAKDKMNSKLF